MNDLVIPGYQTVGIDRDRYGRVWLYMGSDFVCMETDQWERFVRLVTDVNQEQAEDISRPGRGS